MARRRRSSLVSCLRSLLDRNQKSGLGGIACSMCDYYVMGNTTCVILCALIGTVVTALNIIRLMNERSPIKTSSRSRDSKSVATYHERDLKLMTSILGMEHYTFVMLGAITEYPILHAPWLLMQLCVMVLEVILFVGRLLLQGLHVNRNEILLATLVLHNWLQVFCLFYRQIKQEIS